MANLIKLYDEDEDILEDAIIENKQAIEMARIYRDILTGTMDAYASIISNNLNGVMKYLTSITIILAIPTMIASYWGMNVPVPLQENPFGFAANRSIFYTNRSNSIIMAKEKRNARLMSVWGQVLGGATKCRPGDRSHGDTDYIN